MGWEDSLPSGLVIYYSIFKRPTFKGSRPIGCETPVWFRGEVQKTFGWVGGGGRAGSDKKNRGERAVIFFRPFFPKPSQIMKDANFFVIVPNSSTSFV